MTNAQRQARWRERRAAERADDKRILAAIDQIMRATGELRVPFGLSREEWSAFIDREEARRNSESAEETQARLRSARAFDR